MFLMISESFFLQKRFCAKKQVWPKLLGGIPKNIVIIISVTQLAEETYIILQ